MAASIVVVGASLGGVSALNVLLSAIPSGFRVPIAIVQHRAKTADDGLVTFLRDESGLDVSEPDDKDALSPGRVYLAPADYHLLVQRGAFSLSTDAPVNHARPSIDVLFESAAIAYGSGVIGVVLTGSNHDGAWGAAQIKRRGGTVLVQDVSTAESRAMPDAAIAATKVDYVLPLSELARCMYDLCRSGNG